MGKTKPKDMSRGNNDSNLDETDIIEERSAVGCQLSLSKHHPETGLLITYPHELSTYVYIKTYRLTIVIVLFLISKT